MKCKTSELEGARLDAAVAMAEGRQCVRFCSDFSIAVYTDPRFSPPYQNVGYAPSARWQEGGPIIERERLMIQPKLERGTWYGDWRSVGLSWEGRQHADETGPTPLVAAMRAYVASKLGDEVDLPFMQTVAG